MWEQMFVVVVQWISKWKEIRYFSLFIYSLFMYFSKSAIVQGYTSNAVNGSLVLN